MPILELHVPPPPPASTTPSHNLPTLDPESLALITYFSLAIPRGEWSLIPSLPGANPTGLLPALRWGEVWVGGWGNVVDFVGKMGGEEWSLGGREEGDNGQGKRGRGDVIAYSNFIRTKGRALLDLSLFADRANYDALTRPSLASALPFPLSWLEPRRLRDAALARTAHLGIKLDAEDDKDDAPTEAQGEDIIPVSLRKNNSSAAKSIAAEGAVTIRLSALADEFLEPLAEMRGEGSWFVGGRATEVDCLALGYLAVMLVEGLPRPWLAAKVGAVKGLKEWVADVEGVAFEELPWGQGEGGVGVIGRAVGGWVRDAIGLESAPKEAEKEKEEEFLSESEKEIVAYKAMARRREMWVTTGSVVVAVGLFVGFLFQHGVVGAILQGPRDRAQARAAEEEQEEEGLEVGAPWETVEPGVAELASRMNF